jgi:Asp-tRNA(Asn)/Glu-tRNA(Gln) amidotransferase A subunit family amidase
MSRAAGGAIVSAEVKPVPKPTPRSFSACLADFKAGNDTPSAFLERCLETFDAVEPEVLAFVHCDRAAAREAATRSTARWREGKPLSSIDGMPVGVKDIIETRDFPTEMGSALYKGWRSERDAASVAALREAGAVILGKTVTTEFATAPPGPTRNPWDTKRTPGGSSSGSAAAAGSGMVPVGLGTQVIGSILRPASFCGCVGFKPSLGAINRGGSHDALSQSVHGALAASIEDAWVALREIADRVGGDPGYPGLIGPSLPPPAQKPSRLAVLETPGWAKASPAAKAAFEAALESLAGAGVGLSRRGDDPAIEAVETVLARVQPVSQAINTWESRWPINAYRARDPSKLTQFALDRLADAERMSLAEYRERLAERARIRATYAALGARYDAAVTLSATGPAPLGLQSTGDAVFVVAGSCLGVPAISLPLLTAEELPLGLQLLGFLDADAGLIGTARWARDLFAA